MTTAVAPPRTTVRKLVRFTGHHVEMVAAMLIGMMALHPLWPAAWLERADADALVMATDTHRQLTLAVTQARDRLSTGWRPDKGTGRHQRQSRAPGVVQALNRERAALEAHRVTVPEPLLSLRWPDLGSGARALVRLHDVGVAGRLAGPVTLSLDRGDPLLVTGG